MGLITDMDHNLNLDKEEIRVLGSRDLYSEVKQGENYPFSIKYRPLDFDLVKRGCALVPTTGSPAGTNGESFSILVSALINGTEKYKIYKGCRFESTTVDISRANGVQVSQNLRATTITDWGTAPVFSPAATYAPDPTGDPVSGISSGVDPLQINSVVYDTPSFSFTVEQGLQELKINGVFSYKFLEPTNRDISLSLDTTVKDAPGVLIGDMIAGSTWTGRPVVYNITPTVTATFANVKFDSYTSSFSGGSTDFLMEKLAGKAGTVVIAP